MPGVAISLARDKFDGEGAAVVLFVVVCLKEASSFHANLHPLPTITTPPRTDHLVATASSTKSCESVFGLDYLHLGDMEKSRAAAQAAFEKTPSPPSTSRCLHEYRKIINSNCRTKEPDSIKPHP